MSTKFENRNFQINVKKYETLYQKKLQSFILTLYLFYLPPQASLALVLAVSILTAILAVWSLLLAIDLKLVIQYGFNDNTTKKITIGVKNK